VLAACVAGMPDRFGGERMAKHLTELARARPTPDSTPEVVPCCVPVEDGHLCTKDDRLCCLQMASYLIILSNTGKRRKPTPRLVNFLLTLLWSVTSEIERVPGLR
jgi:hypothetical protein